MDNQTERKERMCGCNGVIEQGIGCVTYFGSDRHESDENHETFMRSAGLGFGTDLDACSATMSMHLQANGFSFDEARAILQKADF